jgi:hypothetical protein
MKKLVIASFLDTVAAGVFAGLLVCLPVWPLAAQNPHLAIGLSGPLAFFFVWSCAIVCMWRPIIFVTSLIAFLAVAGVAVGAAHMTFQGMGTVASDDVNAAIGASIVSMIPLFFAWRILSDGFQLATTPAEQRELHTRMRQAEAGTRRASDAQSHFRTNAPQQIASLLDHFVGATKQRQGDRQTKRPLRF